MAPAIKELSRWLDANSEYYVAPDWCDVVKHSVSIIVNGRAEHFHLSGLYIFTAFPRVSAPAAGLPARG